MMSKRIDGARSQRLDSAEVNRAHAGKSATGPGGALQIVIADGRHIGAI